MDNETERIFVPTGEVRISKEFGPDIFNMILVELDLPILIEFDLQAGKWVVLKNDGEDENRIEG